MSQNKCQCGAAVTNKFCEYCRSDNRTPFQKNTDNVVQGVSKVGGQIAGGAKVVATTAVRTLAIFWTLVAIVTVAAIIIVAVVVIVIVNYASGNIGLLNVVANLAASGINFLHV